LRRGTRGQPDCDGGQDGNSVRAMSHRVPLWA
jgi:hypothetical protein